MKESLLNSLNFSEIDLFHNDKYDCNTKRVDYWIKLMGDNKTHFSSMILEKMKHNQVKSINQMNASVPNKYGHTIINQLSNKNNIIKHNYILTNDSNIEINKINIPFSGFINPFLLYGWDLLMNKMFELGLIVPAPHITKEILQDYLVNKINALSYRMLILELNIAREDEHLLGETPQDRFTYFSDFYLSDTDVFNRLTNDYPVLIRLIYNTIDNWVNFISEVFYRLHKDNQLLSDQFNKGKPIGDITKLHLDNGDSHNKNRSVLIIEFDSSLKIVYKPRSLEIDLQFNHLIDFLNSNSPAKNIYQLNVLDKMNYGYVEYIDNVPCELEEEIDSFYESIGSLLALLYILNSVDFHFENIIAYGKHPVLVDLETILHQSIFTDEKAPTAINNAIDLLDRSVLSTGILPSNIYYRDSPNKKGLNVGGLNENNNQETPFKVNQISGRNTDEMKIIKDYMTLTGKTNRPHIPGKEIDTIQYLPNIKEGFTLMYQWISNNKDAFKHEVDKFATIPVRVLLRPTTRYSALLKSSYHPDILRSALDREVLLNRLWIDTEFLPKLSYVISDEVEEMLAGDIPYFLSLPSDTDLYNLFGKTTSHFFESSIIDIIYSKVDQLSEKDCNEQLKILHMSMLASNAKHEADVITLDVHSIDLNVTKTEYLEMAEEIANYLLNMSIEGENENEKDICWVSTVLEGNSELIWDISPIGEDLYNGLSGISLFYAYLFQHTNNTKYKDVAYKSIVPVRRAIAQFKDHPEWSIGAFNGASGYLYSVGTVAYLFNDKSLQQEILNSIPHIMNLIKEDKVYDYIGGSTGAMKIFLSLYKQYNDVSLLEAAKACAEHLIENVTVCEVGIGWKPPWEQIPLTGFSHGVAGVVSTLMELYHITKESKLMDVIKQGLNYERQFFSEKHNNWLTPNREHPSVAWCHGAPGILLSRVLLKYYGYHDEWIDQEIDVALETTIKLGFGNNRSFCHGDFGQIEILLFAAEYLESPHLLEITQNVASQIYHNLKENNWSNGTSRGTESVGLMVGLSGYGYGLMKQYSPETIPSILRLEENAVFSLQS